MIPRGNVAFSFNEVQGKGSFRTVADNRGRLRTIDAGEGQMLL